MNNETDNMAGDLARGYERMLGRIREHLAEAEVNAPLSVYMAIEEARERAVSLGEMTQNEAQQVAGYIKRDLLHARDVLARAQHGLGNWLGIDLALIERGLLETLADPARVDWLRLQQELEAEANESGAAAPGEKKRDKAAQRNKP